MSDASLSSDRALPPGPDLSAWDQAKAWIERPIEFWTECRNTFGDQFTLQFGSLGATVLFCDPQAVREIFALPTDTYECGKFNEHYRHVMGDRSILVLDGDEHAAQRRLLAQEFQASNSPRWLSAIRTVLRRHIEAEASGNIVNVRRFVHVVAFEIILAVLFRDRQSDIRGLLQRMFSDHIIKDYGTWSPWARFAKRHAALRELLAAEIRRTRMQPPHNNVDDRSVFDRMVFHRDERGGQLPDRQIQDHVFTMLVAGVDPSAIATTWAMYWILQHRRVKQRLLDEITAAADVNELVLNNDSYLHATCLESLRMYPVVTTPSGRKLLQGVDIAGWIYPAGITLVPCTYLVHHDKRLYAEPDQFKPSRFLQRSYQSYEYFPFGGGHRRCPGARLATITMKTMIVELLQRLEMDPVSDGPVRPVRHGTLIAPSDNFCVGVKATGQPV